MTGESRIPRSSAASPPSAAGDATPVVAEDKASLRKALHALRRALDPAVKQEWDARICEQLMAWWRHNKFENIGVYWPLAGEPDLLPAYGHLAAAGVRLALPVVLEKNAILGFAEWQPGEAMECDRMGVAVPKDLRAVERPEALVIPCLGFNAHGYRLGYGGGYYDRTLEAEPRPLTLGIAYAHSAAVFPDAPHDVALDLVITERTAPR
ncbi:5-formyltetrahydrofolate cyclo-ligase [Massilia cavernae]|uniref:5-formyltetrahydrofolate cyclo-ligase n=1 Tax=Massilia cavernae TaxID=2320864 RepID=A0A418XQF1_9BURK|nr:5-formyltetrahydrofolate cyclo-ligase [Massilia cavernae]RJG14732.1 5-formyltetrahydrofolate cyclo-ligase [Massilia cavernae]